MRKYNNLNLIRDSENYIRKVRKKKNINFIVNSTEKALAIQSVP